MTVEVCATLREVLITGGLLFYLSTIPSDLYEQRSGGHWLPLPPAQIDWVQSNSTLDSNVERLGENAFNDTLAVNDTMNDAQPVKVAGKEAE